MRILFALLLSCVAAQAANITQLQNRVNTWVTQYMPLMESRQNAYFAINGRYWQGLLTHDIVPAHTQQADNDSVPNRFTIKPHYQIEDWLDMFPEMEGVAIPVALRVDSYNSPLGHGYAVWVYTRHGGTLYVRVVNRGPETYREFPLTVYTETEGIQGPNIPTTEPEDP